MSTTAVQLSAEIVALQEGIGKMYDEHSAFWEAIFGDHIHQGYYDLDVPLPTLGPLNSYGLIWRAEDLSKFPKNVIDVGCGLGGTTHYLGSKYGAKCVGVTLSPYQVQRASELAAAQGLSEKVSFQVANALNLPFPDGHFDFVWSMECGEHMPEREKFISELVRVAAPGATIIVAAWCHRDLLSSEKSLKPSEKQHLDKITKVYHLAEWCSIADYVKLLKPHPVENVKSDDWSKYITPFWTQATHAALSCNDKGTHDTTDITTAMGWMNEGYEKDIIKFVEADEEDSRDSRCSKFYILISHKDDGIQQDVRQNFATELERGLDGIAV
ncbi:hypothetical protein ACFE04_020208 [Oxalis oulophora]